MKRSSKGFTLIELLVVIAIIGILSSVVLASLNSARNKGADAAVKANLSGVRAQAELFYDSTNVPTYEGVCASSGANTIGIGVGAAETAYRGAITTYDDDDASTWNSAQCHDILSAWVAWVPLKASTSAVPSAWCVDSTGTSKPTAALLATTGTVCP